MSCNTKRSLEFSADKKDTTVKINNAEFRETRSEELQQRKGVSKLIPKLVSFLTSH